MDTIKLVVENTFAQNESSSTDLGISVYERVFHKLVKQGGSLGKVQPIYFKTNDRHILFGILTINQNGSYSFFPELPLLEYDHITFVKDLEKNNHHFTRITEKGREKVMPLTAEHLTNNMYHAMLFMCRNLTLLKDVPRKSIYPEVNVTDFHEVQKALVTNDKLEGVTIINLEGVTGSIWVQFFLIPKETDYMTMVPFVDAFKRIQADFAPRGETKLFNGVVPHEYQSDYVLGFIAFMYPDPVDQELMLSFSASRSGFYSKLTVPIVKRKK